MFRTENIYPFGPPPQCNAKLCCRFAVLHVGVPRVGEDAAVDGLRLAYALPFASSVCFYYYVHAGPFYI